jgi:hypothetical protein
VAQTGNVAESSAAVAARGYAGGSKTDWYLPSKDELNEMFINRVAADASDGYWSSTEDTATGAWDQGFSNGGQGVAGPTDVVNPGKRQTTPVRPIRAFGDSPVYVNGTKNNSGVVGCGTSGYFTITSNAVTGTSNCVGSAVVPEGVTSLQSGSGFYNSGVTSITLPSTLITIGDSGLRETGLTSVVIPASVTSIGFLSLASRGITSVTFGAGSQLTTIGNDASGIPRYHLVYGQIS